MRLAVGADELQRDSFETEAIDRDALDIVPPDCRRRRRIGRRLRRRGHARAELPVDLAIGGDFEPHLDVARADLSHPYLVAQQRHEVEGEASVTQAGELGATEPGRVADADTADMQRRVERQADLGRTVEADFALQGGGNRLRCLRAPRTRIHRDADGNRRERGDDHDQQDHGNGNQDAAQQLACQGHRECGIGIGQTRRMPWDGWTGVSGGLGAEAEAGNRFLGESGSR